MLEYLDPVVKADQCAQNVDDIEIAANDAPDQIKCIHQAGLELTIEKCHFGVTKVKFIGRTIPPERLSPQDLKNQNFLHKLRFPESK